MLLLASFISLDTPIIWILFCGLFSDTQSLALLPKPLCNIWFCRGRRESTKQQAFCYSTSPSLTNNFTPVDLFKSADEAHPKSEITTSEPRKREIDRNLALCRPKIDHNIAKTFKPSKECGRVIEVNNLTIWVGSRVLFDNVNFRVHKGECIGIVGNNGNGKSSLLDAVYNRLSGIDTPTTALSASMDIKKWLPELPRTSARQLETYQMLYYMRKRGHSLNDLSHMQLDEIIASGDYSRFLNFESIFTADTSLYSHVAYMRQNYVLKLDDSMLVEKIIKDTHTACRTRISIIQEIEDHLDHLNYIASGTIAAGIHILEGKDADAIKKAEWAKRILTVYNSDSQFVREMSRDLDIKITHLIEMFGMRDMLTLRVGELSGGLKMRLCLLIHLINRPQLLFLDEPTNNLDMESVTFLSTIIKRLIKTTGLSVLLISHNLHFLNTLCSSILHVPGDGTLSLYTGDFDKFVEKGSSLLQGRKSRLQHLEANLKKLQQQYHVQLESTKGSQKQKKVSLSQKRQLIEETEDMVERVRGAQKSSYSDAYERCLLLNTPYANTDQFMHLPLLKRGTFVFPDKPAFTLQNLKLCNKANEALLSNVSLTIHNGDRVLLLGNNGSGKSTLLSLLNAVAHASNTGIEDVNIVLNGQSHFRVESGYCKGKKNTSVNTFSQNCSDLLRSTLSVETLAMNFAGVDASRSEQLTKYLSAFHLQEFMDVNVCDLSFGERSRLLLALQFIRDSAFVFLDEPSNHLDVYMQKKLSHLLNKVYTKGGVVVATHDLQLLQSLERVTTVIYIHERDKVYVFNGEFKDAYHRLKTDKPDVSHDAMGAFLEGCKRSYPRDPFPHATRPNSMPEGEDSKQKRSKSQKHDSRSSYTPRRGKIKNAKRYT
ncbi:putative ABC transporter ATP-binding protein YheS [Babesia sp. Xinjiang]|uniref:putative ABC transporter ATP-binding protein YheS n=1 Tax=Babesia sp. Xinjiang TaxID=462227 RepID=UPI000A264792|nr:putative ABC transporter ATP-binding protein YheS [Babesia sp. Xinjiang]ORM42024.1 putative ABC transporter ATP-binding protein YheS [Babesia sp. Xinjiang]